MRAVFATLLATCLVAVPFAATAKAPKPEPIEVTRVITMQVDTDVEVDTAGALSALTIVTPLDASLQAKLDARVRGWKFHPVLVDGVARRAKARMRVVLAAQKTGDVFEVRIENVVFKNVDTAVVTDAEATRPRGVSSKSITAPRYPAAVLRYMDVIPARVLLGIRVGADGKVAEVTPIQTALYDVAARPTDARDAIREFEKACVQAARAWTFEVPANAASLSADELTVMTPIMFGNDPDKPLKPGEWRREVRSARQALPWLPADTGRGHVGVSDVASSEVFPLHSALALQTDVVGSAL